MSLRSPDASGATCATAGTRSVTGRTHLDLKHHQTAGMSVDHYLGQSDHAKFGYTNDGAVTFDF